MLMRSFNHFTMIYYNHEKNEQFKESIEQQQKIKELTITLREYENIVAGSVYRDNREENQLQSNLLTINSNNKENAVSLDFKRCFRISFKITH